MTIKEAFEKLTDMTAAAMKNPFFVIRKLHTAFADIADEIEDGSGEWELVKKETGAVAITIPNDARELLIIVDISNHSSSVNIPVDVLGETEVSYYGGGYASTSNCFETIVKVSSTKVTLNTVYFNGTSYLSVATCAVYKR